MSGSREKEQENGKEQGRDAAMEFLVSMIISCPHDMSPEQHADLYAREAARCQELVASGLVKRLWRVPGQTANWGLWEAPDVDTLHAAITSFPLWPYMHVTCIPLASNHNDPVYRRTHLASSAALPIGA